MFRAFALRTACAALACSALPVHAATFAVGPGTDCTHTTLQGAVDTAAANASNDVIRIVTGSAGSGIQISTNTNQNLEIVGGWASCSAAAPTGMTTLDGTGNQARSVVALRGNGNFTLRNLSIIGGDQAGDDDGGGIHFQGGGILRIEDTGISNNSADEGGGIYAHGTTTTAELILGANVQISNNTARQHGGGVVAQNIEMTMTAPGSVLFGNTAGGYGGGLLVRSGDFSSNAYIGTSGVGGLGAIYGNHAAIGGGISVFGGEDSGKLARVQLFSTTGSPLRIAANVATQRGGAIDLQPDGDTNIINYEFAVSEAVAELQYVELLENSAPSGAAIFSSENTYDAGRRTVGGSVRFNVPIPQPHPAAVACPFGAPCGSIRANRTDNATGAIIQLQQHSDFLASRVAIEDNEGGWLMYLAGERNAQLALDNSLITGNTVQHALIRDDQNGNSSSSNPVRLHFLTVVGNLIGANGVVSINDEMDLTRSVIDQPGKQLIATDAGTTGGTWSIERNVVSGTPVPSGSAFGPPRFVDEEQGDYMPRAGSHAVDYAPALAGMWADLYGHTRTLDLTGNPNEFGVADAGAIEREYLDPLVLNAEFDADVRHWNLAPGAWDTNQDRDGDATSGAAKVIYEQVIGPEGAAPAAGRSQCIHLPGPGVYELNGHARLSSATPGNRARLLWELREFGGLFGCEDGTPDLTGIHVIATGTAWTRPAAASQIVVPAADWSVNTSLTIRLDVLGSGVGTTLGWFDGIELVKTDDPPSNNPNAADIRTSAGPLVPAFSSDTLDYAIETEDASATVRVNAQVQSSTITVNGIAATNGVSSAPIALAMGPNTVTVEITAPDGATVKTYVLTITRIPASALPFVDGFED